MICIYCRKKINVLEGYNKQCKEFAEEKGLAFHEHEHVPAGAVIQCSCGAFNEVEESV